jgi:hypothetical protein
MSDNHKSPDPIGIAEGYTPAKPYTPPHEEREQVARIQELFTAAEQSRRQYDYNWEFYKLYLQGNQVLGRDMVTGETVRVNLRPEDRKRHQLPRRATGCAAYLSLSELRSGWLPLAVL